jgi:hypothetical protein
MPSLPKIRLMGELPSERAFLQEFDGQWDKVPKRSNYFRALKSSRRADIVQELNPKISAEAESPFVDRLAELADYEVLQSTDIGIRALSPPPSNQAGKTAPDTSTA